MRFLRKIQLLTISAALFPALCGATPAAQAGPVSAAADSTSTAMAILVGKIVDSVLADYDSKGISIDRGKFITGLADFLSGKPADMTPKEAGEYISRLHESTRNSGQGADYAPADAEAQTAFVDAAAARPGATRLPSGTIVEALEAGTGDFPQKGGSVVMRYRGTLADGTVFDEIEATEEAPVFPTSSLTPGLTEALTSGLMRAGGKYRVTLPPTAAYGDEGIPGYIPPGSALEFTIELSGTK